jgi:hypothetical protein
VQTGIQDLGIVSGTIDGFNFTVYGVSDDGASMVFTKLNLVGVPEAWRWTQAGGQSALPPLPGTAPFSAVSGMTADGATMVGVCGQIAVTWTAAGVQSLPAMLENAGYDMSNWLTTSENSADAGPRVSASGNTIAGVGRYLTGPNPSDFVYRPWMITFPICGSPDFNHDGATATDADIEAFFACIAGNCCSACDSADFNGDGAVATDADIESFFRVLAGEPC